MERKVLSKTNIHKPDKVNEPGTLLRSTSRVTGDTSGTDTDGQDTIKGRKKKKKRKEVPIHKIPGVRRITLSELTQKIVDCRVGDQVTSEKPWFWVRKHLLIDNLELHEESSEFLPIKNELIECPLQEILIGYIAEDTGDVDEFYICLTVAATEAVSILIKEYQAQQEARLHNSVYKEIKHWTNLGSNVEVDEWLPKKSRNLIEVEIESKYPILPFKVQFRLRNVEDTKDGYMELLGSDRRDVNIFRKRIDSTVQVTPSTKCNEAQTLCTYPSNSITQYEYCIEINENEWKSFHQIMSNFFRENYDKLFDNLNVNRNLNLYTDDYAALVVYDVSDQFTIHHFSEYMSFHDVNLCKDKMISCANWTKMISGIVVISYTDMSSTIYLKKLLIDDEVYKAIHGLNPVLVWSFLDPLNPKLILETQREITTVSFCPWNENIVVGGAVNGQIVIWDITGKISQVEQQEVLTNAQQKYRSYMMSLMGWMKNIYDVKQIRATAVSDMKNSHHGAVVRIQWISPFEEVGKTGKPKLLSMESDERSLQFITAGEDGVVMIWDLLKKPSVQTGGFRERKLKRLKRKPEGLSMDISPFRVLHLNLKPVYKINISPTNQTRSLACSMLCYDSHQVVYENVDKSAKPAQSFTDRMTFKAHPVLPSREFVSNFYLGTMEGDFCEVTWEGRDFDLGAVVNAELCSYVQFVKFHDGPVQTLSRNSTDKLLLTTGGKVFALWCDDFKNQPIFWRRSRALYTSGSWYKFHTNKFRVIRSDGIYETWCVTSQSKSPSTVVALSSASLTCINKHGSSETYRILGIADQLGSYRIFVLKDVDTGPKRYSNMKEYVTREVKRKKNFLSWQKDWSEKFVRKEEEAATKAAEEAKTLVAQKTSQEKLTEMMSEAVKVDEESRKEDKDKDKSVKIKDDDKQKKGISSGRYLEWVKEKELAKEQERIKKIILQKKRLDTKELEKQRKPLQKLEEENELRKKKQRARIRSSEMIFKETVAMLFPAIVKEKAAPPPDPYAGGDPIEEQDKCYKSYQEIAEHAEQFIKSNDYRVEFNWKEIIKEARERRQYLDNSFEKAIHYKRFAEYKTARNTVDTEDDNISSRIDSQIKPSETVEPVEELFDV